MKKQNTQYLKFGKLELSLGNSKLGDDTIILNMGSATYCPSRALGFCKLGDACYAYKAENMYSGVGAYRDRQETYWKKTDARKIADDIINALKSRRGRVDGKLIPMLDKIKYLRFNESGDFWSQASVKKLSTIAAILMMFDIVTYGYTAREDLDFDGVYFKVRGSSNDVGNSGKAIAREADKLADLEHLDVYREADTEYTVCKSDCATCHVCKETTENVVFPIH